MSLAAAAWTTLGLFVPFLLFAADLPEQSKKQGQ
jgi:hypothetical protein